MNIKYKRIILKLSGEALADKRNFDILDAKKLNDIANIIKTLQSNKVEIGVVIGAGNIFRGKIAHNLNIEQKDGDYMGMVATIVNCLALSNILTKKGVKNKVMSALEVQKVAESYNAKKAKNYLSKKNVVLFAAGTGKPFYTTDTCASLRAVELDCDAILVGKNGVDGIYDKDPNTNKNAKFIKSITFKDFLKKDLKVMDKSAISILKNKKISIKIFSMDDMNNFIKVIQGKDIGSTIED